MAIEVLSSGGSETATESFGFSVDYDTVGQTIGLTCSGQGHGILTVVRVSNGTPIGRVSCDPYMDGQRHVVAGPGAVGTNLLDGQPLPTGTISSAIVGVVNPPKGTQPGLEIDLTWGP